MGQMGEQGQRLEQLGYRLVPENQQRVPLIQGWTNGAYRARPEHDDADVGLVCGQGDAPVYALDVDSGCPAFSAWFEAQLRQREGWDDMPVRVGRAPRFAVLAQGDAPGIGTMTTGYYRHADGRRVLVEFLGAGRKITIYGTHKITNKPYTWRGGMAPHQGRSARHLPDITKAGAQGLLDLAEAWLRQEGFVFGTPGSSSSGSRVLSAGEGPSMLHIVPALGVSLVEAVKILDEVRLDDRDTWLNAGMAMHHEFQGSDDAFDAWHERSSQCEGYQGEADCRRVWDSFGTRDGRPPRTMRWLQAQARQAASPQAIAQALQASSNVVPLVPREGEKITPAILSPTPPAQEKRPETFQVYYPPALQARQANISWLVKPILADQALSMVYGDSGVGKSFTIFDLACRMSLGWDWFGHRVRQGTVIYVAAEGQSGVSRRLEAFALHHNVDLAEIQVATVIDTPDLRSTDWIKLAETVRQVQEREGNVVQVFIDTLAATTPGANENASEDMGAFLGNVRNLIQATGVGFTVVHHAGKDASKGARGHSSLRAACDSIIEVSRESMDSDVRKLKLVKSRDSADGLEWFVGLQDVDLGVDQEGDIITSKVVVAADAPPPDVSKKLPKQAKWQQCVLSALQALQDHNGVVRFDDLVQIAVATYYPQHVNSQHAQADKTLRRAVRRACEGLEAKGVVRLFFTPKMTIEFVELCNKELLF